MNKTNRKVFDLAFEYVCSFPNVTPEIVRKHFEDYKRLKENIVSLEDIYLSMLNSPLSMVQLGNAIGKAARFEEELKGFNPNKILQSYPSWQDFFKEIEKSGKSKIQMDISNKRTYWYKFSHTVIDAARYLSRFENGPAFRKYIERQISEGKHVELIKTICEDPETKVFGFGWALSCEFLKEIGYTDFIKMDSHLTGILSGLGIVTSSNGEVVYKQSIAFAESIGERPFTVDKLFYLSGSGKIYLLDNYHYKFTNDKRTIQYIQERLRGIR
jgi:thermostable 8-oxoguanine DNA glycosylase